MNKLVYGLVAVTASAQSGLSSLEFTDLAAPTFDETVAGVAGAPVALPVV